MRKAKLYQLLAVAGGLSTAVATTPVLAADSVNVSMPTNNPPISEYKITLVDHAGNSGKDWTYKVEWVKGKNLSHWDLSLGSCLSKVTNAGGGSKETSGDRSNANPAAGADTAVKGSQLIKWDTEGGTFTITMDKAYQTKEVSVLAKTATVYNTGKVTGPDCTKEVVSTPAPVVYDFTSPQSGSDPSPFSGNGSKCQVGGQTVDVKGMLLGTTSTVNYDTGTVTAEVVNNSGAPQTVTLVTYKEYYGHTNYADVKDSNGNIVKRGQTVHDFETKTVPVGVSQFTVDMPGCSTQIDFVCGEVINYLGDELYGNRKLDWYHAHEGNGNVWCEEPPVVDETPVDETPVDETPVDETPVDETPVDETPVDETPVDETPVDSSGGGILGNGDENTSCDDINGSNGVPMSLIAKYETNGSGEYVFEKGTDIINITDANLSGGTWSVEGGVVKVGAIIVKGGTTALPDEDGNDSFSNAGLTNKGGQTADISNIQFCEVPVFDASEQVCLWSANKDADGNYTNITQEGCTDAEQGKFYAIEAGGEFSSALEAE